jgi:retron-type reverse transcriptase
MPIERSAIDLLNKLVFVRKKAYVVSYDGKSYFEFGAKINQQLDKIIKKINNRTYTFSPTRLIKVKTKPNKLRDIYISAWDDKIIESWLNDCLNKLLHHWFSKNSYAYRIEDLGLDSCQYMIAKAVKQSQFFAKRDIAKFFYSIDNQILLNQLSEVIDTNDYLYELLRQRICFKYSEDGTIKDSALGVPFGSALACTLSNIHLTAIDKQMVNYNVNYFRYADDVLICSTDPIELKKATQTFDTEVSNLKLSLKQSHTIDFSFVKHPDFELVREFSHLGLRYVADGMIKLAIEKQRKIINLFKRELKWHESQIKKASTIDEKLKITINAANAVIKDRIRSAAIVDYYLKHVTDELQLKRMDKLLAEMIISNVLDRPFHKGHFKTIPFKKLRNMQLVSLLHRNRLHRHGRLKVSFLSLYNELVYRRHCETLERRQNRINHIRMARKMRSGVQLTTE